MTTVIMAWPLKRSAVARLQQYADGTRAPVPGTSALVGAEVSTVMPANPDRLCVYGAPIAVTRTLTTAERVTSRETVTLELRVRAYQPGTGDEDVADVDELLGELCQAVAVALIDYEPIIEPGMGEIRLARIQQWPTLVTPSPEPGAAATASLYFEAAVVTT